MTPAWTTDAATSDPARAVHLTLFWGLDGVALRTLGGARVPEITEGPLRRRLDESDLPVVAVEPGLFEGPAARRAQWLNDVDRLTEVAAFGRRVGCGLVRVGALAGGPDGFDAAAAVGALRQAGARAEAEGLRLAVRNEAGTGVATGAALAALLADVAHASVGADWRPAEALAAGEGPADGLAALLGAGVPLVCVGVRDGVAAGDGWDEAVVGEGAVDWAGQLAAIAGSGFEGPLVIDALPDPPRSTGLASGTALVRLARRARRDAGRG